MFYGRDLFADQEEWFVETVRAAAANDARQLGDQAAPGERLEAQARRCHRRARRAGRDPRSTSARYRRTCACSSPTSDVSTWSLFDVDRLGRDDPRLGRVRAPVLRRARPDRRDRLLLRPRFHRRLRRRRRVPAPARADPGRPAARRPGGRARPTPRACAVQAATDALLESFKTVYMPLERIDHPFEATIVVSARSPEELRRRPGPRRASGRCAHASSTTSSCRSFVSMRGSSSSGSAARRAPRLGREADGAAQLAEQPQRRLVPAAVRVAERPRPADLLDEVARALELVALRALVEQAEPSVLPAVADHLVAAAHELAAAVEREVEQVRERARRRPSRARGRASSSSSLPLSFRQALLQRALHEHRRGRVVAVRRRVLRPDPIWIRRPRRGSGGRALRGPTSRRAGTACAARRAGGVRRRRAREGRRRR